MKLYTTKSSAKRATKKRGGRVVKVTRYRVAKGGKRRRKRSRR